MNLNLTTLEILVGAIPQNPAFKLSSFLAPEKLYTSFDFVDGGT
jgi:hypothetical protein